MAMGREPQKPLTSTTGTILYSSPLPSSGGSGNECIHTERRSSTGDINGFERNEENNL